jgi:hypothetical protein
MAQINTEFKFTVNSDKVTNQLEKVTKAAEKLNNELKKLEKIEIVVNVVEVNKKWWQFYK